MKKSTAAVIAILLVAACIGDVYQTHQAEIRAMQNSGYEALKAAVDAELYREPEKTEVVEILESTEASISESEDQAEIDALIKKAKAKFGEFKTDAEYTAEEEAARQAAAAASRKSKKKKSSGSQGCVGTGSDVFN